ncbi:MAG: transcription termination/antitermination protein NusG [Limnohabitans sp.]|jgi:transcriptional antiterminator NusG|nr:transcription termination/antitermination protein NusG [Limnohabitans sp.]
MKDMTEGTDNTEATHTDAEASPKTLKRGVDARRAVERPHEVMGVSTQALAATQKGKAGEKSKLEQTESFDPATDLPMFREGMNWFVLRVASNKERSVRQTLLRKVQIEGMEAFVGRIMVPTEKTKSLKGGKQRITESMLYPGYVFVEMRLEPDGRIPQDVFFLIKETDGVGDFVGTAGRPTPMAQHEVEKMLFDSRKPEEAPQVKMEFAKGDKVTIQDGPFQNYEGEIDEVLPEKGLVRVLVTIFGRQAPIELEYWQVRKGVEERD